MQDFCGSLKLFIGHMGGRLGLVLGVALMALITGQSAQAFQINVIYPNPGNVPEAAQAEITSVVSFLNSTFINPATVINIMVDFTSACGLGCSNTLGFTGISYARWRNAMIADAVANPQNTFLAAAISTLPVADPIGNGTLSLLRTANAEALGLATFAGIDSYLTFNNGASIFEFTGVATPGRYDFQNIFEHELDEALGIGSSLNNASNSALPASFEPEDYFRYVAVGTRLLTTDPNAPVFFSYNGITGVAQFNQFPLGDRNDWIYGNFGCPAIAALVQNAFECPNEVASYNVTSPEFIVLQTLGYNRAAVPEPSTWLLLGSGLAGLLGYGWRQRKKTV